MWYKISRHNLFEYFALYLLSTLVTMYGLCVLCGCFTYLPQSAAAINHFGQLHLKDSSHQVANCSRVTRIPSLLAVAVSCCWKCQETRCQLLLEVSGDGVSAAAAVSGDEVSAAADSVRRRVS